MNPDTVFIIHDSPRWGCQECDKSFWGAVGGGGGGRAVATLRKIKLHTGGKCWDDRWTLACPEAPWGVFTEMCDSVPDACSRLVS